ncbi:ribonuclease H-like domain-containing protein [Fomitopsis betulina]|nr:ribonuclease H-like domain-containing protein [Fomitopsis betulina]
MSSHALQPAIIAVLQLRDLKLNAMKLTPQEWKLSTDLWDMLDCIHELIQHFQQDDVPLIIDVYPAFDQLQQDFLAMEGNTTLPNVCRVAAHAGYLVTCKYYNLFNMCEAYTTAVVMCPNRKLQWFIDRNWSDEALEIIRTRARVAFQRFRTAPPPAHAHSGPASSTTSAQATISAASTASPFHPGPTMLASIYVTSDSIRFGAARFRSESPGQAGRRLGAQQPANLDSIKRYLASDPVELPPGMSVIQYWNSQLAVTPCLVKMGLAFTSAPATTADAERAFSEGRNQIAWNQHAMSSQTFRAKASLGAWADAPWFSNEMAEKIIAGNSRPLCPRQQSASVESLS